MLYLGGFSRWESLWSWSASPEHFDEGALTESESRIGAAREAYDATNLINNPAKGFVKEVGARFWGLELDGEKGLLRSSTWRMWPLAFITMRVASLGLASVGLLEAIAGSWVSILGIRRRLYSVMDIIFEPLCVADQKIVLRLSPELVSQLEALVVLGSLAVVNLRADFYCQIVATDASGDCMAGVAVECPEKVLREVSGIACEKGHGLSCCRRQKPEIGCMGF